MHDRAVVDAALALFRGGAGITEISRGLGVPPTTVWHWCHDRRAESAAPDSRRERCPRCHGTVLDDESYAYLLGQYLGDGHIVVGRRGVASLSIFCADDWPGVRGEVEEAMRGVMPSSAVSTVQRVGCGEIKSYSTHWPCLFPQHGPGRKHERSIRLTPWQEEVVAAHPGPLLRGLIHSDGCRTTNWARSRPKGKRYEYPRYWFSNESEDILGLCAEALDRLGVEHRRPRRNAISVARRASVARLDDVVGPKY